MKKNGFPVLRNRLYRLQFRGSQWSFSISVSRRRTPGFVVDLIDQQKGVEEERILYRNTRDDSDVTIDYKFEDLGLHRGGGRRRFCQQSV